MVKQNQTLPNPLLFGLPILIIIGMVFLSKSSFFQNNPDSLSIGIIADLTLTVPLLYFLLIRKSEIPKTTIIPVFVLGIVIASLIIPQKNQQFLELIKHWILPVVELSALTYIIIKVRKAIRLHKQNPNRTYDFYSNLKYTTNEILPKRAAALMAMEFATIYYSFFTWKKKSLQINEFTYHKETGTRAIMLVVIFLIAIETFVFHILLERWSSIAAWILTILSIYSGIQIFGFLKSLSQRPISIENNKLKLRYGIMAEANLPLDQIEDVELTTKNIEPNGDTQFLSPLGQIEGQNMVIHFKSEQQLTGLYGSEKTFTNLAIHVDQPQILASQLDKLTCKADD